MNLGNGAIEEFRRLYLEDYGKELTDQQARDYAGRLIGLVRAVYGNDLPKMKPRKHLTNEEQKANN